MTALLVSTAVILDLAALWKLCMLVIAPHDRPLRAVALCLMCVAACFSLGLRAEARAVDSIAGDGAARWLSNALLLSAAYWLMLFYLYSGTEYHKASRRAVREAIPLTTALILLTLAALTTPASGLGHTYASAEMRIPQVAVFFVTAGLYLVYVLATASLCTWRYARMSLRPLSTGLWMTTTALVGMVVANILRVAIDLMRWRGYVVPPAASETAALLLTLAVPQFVIGVTYPGTFMRLSGVRLWRQHRRAYRQLRPLWVALHEAFPEDALNRATSNSWREILQIRAVHRRYYRRVIECRDGLVRISPYLASLGVHDEDTPAALAQQLQAALRSQAAGQTVSARALGIALPAEDSLDADAMRLIALSDALASR